MSSRVKTTYSKLLHFQNYELPVLEVESSEMMELLDESVEVGPVL